MQVQHDPRPGGSRRRQRPPPETRMQVVRVHDPRRAEAYRLADLGGPYPAPQQSGPRRRTRKRARAAREQLRRLAQLLAHEPHQVLHNALLAAGRAIAVVQEQDHRVAAA